MERKRNFFESEVCASGHHCDICRARHAGADWRTSLRKVFRLQETDFACPHGKAWTEDGAEPETKPDVSPASSHSKSPQPCGGCGKKKVRREKKREQDGAKRNKPEEESQDDTLWEVATPPLLGQTRPSCLECVEKHLGAAMVLLSETKNGYPHYLLAVGHLHEAEDESQAWPELVAAIRAARKELQAKGRIALLADGRRSEPV